MEGWLTFVELKRITKFLDAFCGTVEPSFRNVYFYYDNALKVYATDGCAKLYINVTKEFLPFNGMAAIPIQYLKGIIRDKNLEEDSLVKLSVDNENILFEIQGMTLNSKIQKINKKEIEINKEFSVITKKKLNVFLNKLDFVSASANEGDIIDIFTHENKLLFGYLSNYYRLNTVYSPTKIQLHREIPFISSRHLVKSLNHLKKDNILELGVDEKNIILKTQGIFIKICSTHPSFSKKLINFEDEFLEKKVINANELRNVLNKLYVTFHGSNIAYLVFNKKNSYVYKEDNNSKISFKLSYSFDNQYLITIHTRKMRSILSRMSNNLNVYLSPKELIFEDEKNEKKASFSVSEFNIK
jgi:hypothetical protein